MLANTIHYTRCATCGCSVETNHDMPEKSTLAESHSTCSSHSDLSRGYTCFQRSSVGRITVYEWPETCFRSVGNAFPSYQRGWEDRGNLLHLRIDMMHVLYLALISRDNQDLEFCTSVQQGRGMWQGEAVTSLVDGLGSTNYNVSLSSSSLVLWWAIHVFSL